MALSRYVAAGGVAVMFVLPMFTSMPPSEKPSTLEQMVRQICREEIEKKFDELFASDAELEIIIEGPLLVPDSNQIFKIEGGELILVPAE